MARHGELDVAGWWGTRGLLGPTGRTLYARSFPETHAFARGWVVVDAARARCRELYPARDALTPWTLPPELEGDIPFRFFLASLEELAERTEETRARSRQEPGGRAPRPAAAGERETSRSNCLSRDDSGAGTRSS